MTGIRDLPIEERRRLVEEARLRNWPVGIRLSRTRTAFGIVTHHDHATGSLVAYMSVGANVQIGDVVFEKPDGTVEVVQGVAGALLDICQQTNLKVVA